MNFSAKLIRFFIISLSLTIIFGLSLPICSVIAKKKNQNIIDLQPNQSFSSGPDSTIEYNFYIQNKGKSVVSYSLTTFSDKGYYVEVWRDTDGDGILDSWEIICGFDPNDMSDGSFDNDTELLNTYNEFIY